MNFRVDDHLPEKLEIPQRPIDLTRQDRFDIDGSLDRVCKCHMQHIRSEDPDAT